MNLRDINVEMRDLQFNALEQKVFSRSPLLPDRGGKKNQLVWMQLVLEKLSQCSYEDLEYFSEELDKILEQVHEREEQEAGSSVKVEYKLISDSYYAYLREWGGEQVYKAIGCAYFQPFRKYKLVNKQTKEVKILASLGLWRLEEDKLYLLIQYAYPDNILREYLFWDFSLKFPAEPKAPQRLLGKYFAKKQWEYYCLGEVDNFDELRIDKSTLTFVSSALMEIPQLKIILDIPQDKEQNKLALKEVDLGIEPITIKVATKYMADVIEKLRTWQALSRVLVDPGLTKLKTFWDKDNNSFILASIHGQELVILNENANSLYLPNPQLLWKLLWQITIVISSAKKVKPEHQQFAERLSEILQNKQSYDTKQFLAHLLMDNK